jgi:hypothetical protein
LQRNNELLFFRIEVVAASEFALSTFCHACLLALLVILAVAGEVLWPATRKAIRVQGLGFQYDTGHMGHMPCVICRFARLPFVSSVLV